jgi:hypothetical protein
MARRTQFEDLARRMAERIEAEHQAGEQLTLLPDEGQPAEGGGAGEGRGKGKALSQMRAFLAHRGFRAPEDVLVQMAGMASSEDAFIVAMTRAEQVLAWMGQDAVQRIYTPGEGHKLLLDPRTGEPLPWEATPEQRLDVFRQVYTVQLRALEALLPYGLAKASPDVSVQQTVQVVVPGGQQAAPRDVTPRRAGADRSDMAPPPLPGEIKRNQHVSADDAELSDGKDRTE